MTDETYDPVPDLATLLTAASNYSRPTGLSSGTGAAALARLQEHLGLEPPVSHDTAEDAIRAALEPGLEYERHQLPESPCLSCGGGFQQGARAWAMVWDGERYWLQVRYVLTMPLGPYHTGCIGQSLNERNAPQPEKP